GSCRDARPPSRGLRRCGRYAQGPRAPPRDRTWRGRFWRPARAQPVALPLLGLFVPVATLSPRGSTGSPGLASAGGEGPAQAVVSDAGCLDHGVMESLGHALCIFDSWVLFLFAKLLLCVSIDRP